MKTLDLENYGVEELSKNEKISINGGAEGDPKWWEVLLATAGVFVLFALIFVL